MVHTGDTFSVYVLRNLTNGKVYVGCTRLPVKARWDNGKGYSRNKALKADIEKYGWDGFSHEVVESGLDYETAASLEVDLILEHLKRDPSLVYNTHFTKGAGLYGYKERGHHAPWNLGMKHSEESRKRMSESHKGIKQSPEWVEKRIAQIRGRPFTEEHIKNLVPICRENAEKNKKRCRTINVSTGEVMEYDSLAEARDATGCTCISNAIKLGVVRKGYRFEYL